MDETFTWDNDALRFRDSKGRFVAPSVVREAVDAVAASAASDLQRLAADLIAGRIDLGTFEASARDLIKQAYLATGSVAVGGKDNLDASDLGRIGNRLKREYTYLRQFAREIDRGELSPDQIKARIAMYGSGATRAYEATRRGVMAAGGYSEERRILNSAIPCSPCSEYAALGWQPIGTLPNTGEACDCLSRCRCSFTYRKRRDRPAIESPRDLALPDDPGPDLTPTPRLNPPAPPRKFRTAAAARDWAARHLATPIQRAEDADHAVIDPIVRTLAEYERRFGRPAPVPIRIVPSARIEGNATAVYRRPNPNAADAEAAAQPGDRRIEFRDSYLTDPTKAMARSNEDHRRLTGSDVPFGVSRDLRDVLWHELGHAHDFDTPDGRSRFGGDLRRAADDAEDRAKLDAIRRLSGYAQSDWYAVFDAGSEAWAEAFAAVATGHRAEFVPPAYRRAIDALMRELGGKP